MISYDCMIIEIKVGLNTVQQKNVYDNTNTNIISSLFNIFSLQIDISHQVLHHHYDHQY